MQEYVEEKMIALCKSGGRMTSRTLARMMQAYLRHRQRVKSGKGNAAAPLKHGEQSMDSLKKEGASIAEVEITGDNIGSFRKIAREHKLDFNLKRDDSADPPKWIVSFKAKDERALESAFKKYSQEILNQKSKKPSLKKRVEKNTEHLKSVPAPVKNVKRGGHEL